MQAPAARPTPDETPMAISAREPIWIEGGTFTMGSDSHYPEEAPAHPVKVDGFWIDVTPVTNRQFGAFVEATGYVTVAEKAPDPKDYPGAKPEMMRAGSVIFDPPKRVVSRDSSQWWDFKFGADWRRPYGRQSNIRGKLDHPVVHISYIDAMAYAAWAGKDLPSSHPEPAPKSCCIPSNPRGGGAEASYDPRQPEILIARRVVKGGSHLCAPNYCRRYRPAARHAHEENAATTHIGFRCIRRP